MIDPRDTADTARAVLQRVDAQLQPRPFDLVQPAAELPAAGR